MAEELVTTSNLLPVIVDDIRAKAFEIQHSEGVWKKLVTQVGMGEKGDAVIIPRWDPNTATAQTLTEGIAMNDAATYVNDTVRITAVETGHYTILTKNDEEDATDNVKERHATQHGITLANAVEIQGHEIGQDFAAHVDLTGAELTDLDLMKFKATIQAGKVQASGNYHCVGSSGNFLSVMASLYANPSFGLKGTAGQDVQAKYHVGTVFGDIDLYATDIPYDATAATHAGAFFKSDAIGLFVPRMFDMQYEYDARLRGTRLISTQRYGFGIKSDKLGLRFTADNGLLVPTAERGIVRTAIVNDASNPVVTQEVAALS